MDALPERIRAFAFDQRGHGDAAKPADGYGLRDFADDIGAFVDAVGLDAAVLVGASSRRMRGSAVCRCPRRGRRRACPRTAITRRPPRCADSTGRPRRARATGIVAPPRAAISTGPRTPPRRSSAAGCTPATGASSTRMATCGSSAPGRSAAYVTVDELHALCADRVATPLVGGAAPASPIVGVN